jgi:hypothetical protein
MSLVNFSDDKLLNETALLVSREREILSAVLFHLREIQRRRLYAKLGYNSLFAYAVGELRYGEDQALRRIAAMRMLKEFPGLAEKVQRGALSLSAINLARTVFRKKEFSRREKMQILASLEKKSSREAEKILAAYYPAIRKPDKMKHTAAGEITLSFTANADLREKIEKVRGLWAHKHPGISLGELFEKLCDQALAVKAAAPRVIPSMASVRRGIRGKGNCENCGSNYALEIDHRFPKALGGTDAKENLRLLCRSCNQRAAIEILGQEKMDPFLSG